MFCRMLVSNGSHLCITEPSRAGRGPGPGRGLVAMLGGEVRVGQEPLLFDYEVEMTFHSFLFGTRCMGLLAPNI